MSELIVPHRFCGPPDSGNGGWSAGALAGMLGDPCPDDHAAAWPTIEVSLRQPPPLDTPLRVTPTADGEGCEATFGGAVIATARCSDHPLVEVEAVDAATARAAQASYAGHRHHAFPTCFACGTDRAEGDGLRIFPGPVDGGRLAATWTPHASVREDWHGYLDDAPRASVPATWAALDCVGGWAGGFASTVMVLGRITARLDTLPVVGEEHVVVGAARGAEGRKTFTAVTLYDADRRVVATAEHVWISVDAAAFGASPAV